jgi:hypothetical protein
MRDRPAVCKLCFLFCDFSFSSDTGGRLGVLGALLPDRLRSSMLLDLELSPLLHLQCQCAKTRIHFALLAANSSIELKIQRVFVFVVALVCKLIR